MKLLLTTIAAVVLVGCGLSVDIWTAAKEGNIEAVKQHLAAGTDVNTRNGTRNDYFETPLHNAATHGHKEIVELLIAKGAYVNVKGGSQGGTPLHDAAQWGRKEVAELLIVNGADVNGKDRFGSTPLHEAKTKEVAELLIAKGADVNAKADNGKTPLDEAILPFSNKSEIANLLRKHGGKTGEELNNKRKPLKPYGSGAQPETTPDKSEESDNLIYHAVRERNIELVKQHLADGKDVNAKNKWGRTPLHLSVGIGDKKIVELLISNGANVNGRDKAGWTALNWAENKEIAELLISKGADVNATDDVGRTLLDRFNDFRQLDLADLLRKHGGKTGEELKAEDK